MAPSSAGRTTRRATPGGPARADRAAAAMAAVASGAQRASGERAVRQRRTTPLLADRVLTLTVDPTPATKPPVAKTSAGKAPAAKTSAGKAPAAKTPVAKSPATKTQAVKTPVAKPPATKTQAVKTPAAKPSTGKVPAGKVPVAKVPAAKTPAAKTSAGKAPAAKASPGTSTVPAAAAPAAPGRRTPPRRAPGVRRGAPLELAAVDGLSTGTPPAREPLAPGGGAAVIDATTRGPRRTPSGPSRPRVRVRAVTPADAQSEGIARWERLIAVASVAEQAGEELADALRTGERQAGEVEERIAQALRLLRRRLTGEYEVDEFGFDPELTDKVLFALLRPLYRQWFRVEVSGIENIPATGGALIVANHSGAIALDALMTSLAVHDEHPSHRFLRALGADLVFQTPFVGEVARKGGATLAANADAERLLSGGHLVGVWPEGFKGIGKPFSERYKLQRFGRGGFVSAALRTRTPIIPCSIVGAEETYPIIGNLPTLARLLGLPYLPVTPTWPWLGPLGLIPLPSKWLIEFGAPVATDELGIGAADDPMLVFDLTDQIRQTIQQTLYSLLIQRRSVFF